MPLFYDLKYPLHGRAATHNAKNPLTIMDNLGKVANFKIFQIKL